MNSEVLNLVFHHFFNLLDLFETSNKNICKDWNKLIDKILIDRFTENNELVIFLHCLPKEKSYFNYYWNHDGKKVNSDNYIGTSPLEYQKKNWKYFKLVKKLYIISLSGLFHFDLKIFWKKFDPYHEPFINLEHFQIENQSYKYLTNLNINCYYNLNYKKLKTLYIGLNQHIENINCPDLIELSLFTELKVTNNQFKNLKYLSCGSLFYIPGTIKFDSLETLVLYEQKSILFLNDFPQLKQIHFFYTWQTSTSFIDTIKLELTNRTIKNLQIFMNGIKIEKIKPFEKPINNDYKICKYNLFFRNNYEKSLAFCVPVKSKLFKLYQQNCNQFNFKLTNLGIVYSNEFGKTIVELDQNLAEKFSKCFNNMVIYEQINYDLFIRCKLFFRYVYLIRIKNVDQNLLDLLPIVMPNLRIVNLNPIDLKKKEKNINFYFLGFFNNLCFSNVNLKSLTLGTILSFISNNKQVFTRLDSYDYQIILSRFINIKMILYKGNLIKNYKETPRLYPKFCKMEKVKEFDSYDEFCIYLKEQKLISELVDYHIVGKGCNTECHCKNFDYNYHLEEKIKLKEYYIKAINILY